MAGYFAINKARHAVELRDVDYDDKLDVNTWLNYLNSVKGISTINDSGNSIAYFLSDYLAVDDAKYNYAVEEISKFNNQMSNGIGGAIKENYLPLRMPDPGYFIEQMQNIKAWQKKHKDAPKEQRDHTYGKMRDKFVTEFVDSISLCYQLNYETAKKHDLLNRDRTRK